MPATSKVSGIFYLTMKVVDTSGNEIANVANGVTARHEIEVENISTTSRHVEVAAHLPNGLGPLEFVVSGSAAASWREKNKGVVPTGTCAMGVPIRRGSGGARQREPIQCDEVQDGRGTLWRKLSAGVPFQMTVDAV